MSAVGVVGTQWNCSCGSVNFTPLVVCPTCFKDMPQSAVPSAPPPDPAPAATRPVELERQISRNLDELLLKRQSSDTSAGDFQEEEAGEWACGNCT